MKRESLELQEADWAALEKLAALTGSLYSGKPSWRRLVKRIARGEIAVGESGSFSGSPAPLPKVKPSLVPRNAPCPCGSGQKFKRCCGR